MRMDRALHSERFTSDLVFWRLNSVCFISTAFEYEKFGSKNVRNKPLESRQKSGSANPANFAAQKYRMAAERQQKTQPTSSERQQKSSRHTKNVTQKKSSGMLQQAQQDTHVGLKRILQDEA